MCKKLGKPKPSFSSKKSNLYLLHFLSRLWPIFGTQENGTKLVQQFCQICSKKILSKILRIKSFRTFHERNPRNSCWRLSLLSFLILRRFPVFSQFCLRTPYGSDFAGMGIAGQWGLVCDVRTLSGALYPACCSVHSIVMYFIWYTTPHTKDHRMYLDGFSREVKIARRQIGLLGALCVAVVAS